GSQRLDHHVTTAHHHHGFTRRRILPPVAGRSFASALSEPVVADEVRSVAMAARHPTDRAPASTDEGPGTRACRRCAITALLEIEKAPSLISGEGLYAAEAPGFEPGIGVSRNRISSAAP